MPNPLSFFREAAKAVPAIRYALGIGGIVSVIAIIFSFRLSPAAMVFGVIIMLTLMMMLVIFARATTLGPRIYLPALIFTWFTLSLFMVVSTALFTSVFFRWPLDLAVHFTGSSHPSNPPAITSDSVSRADAGQFKFVSLGFDANYVRSKLGVPAKQYTKAGFVTDVYVFKDFDVTILYDLKATVMQYGVYLKERGFHLFISEFSDIVGHEYLLGKETFWDTRTLFEPMLMSPWGSDSESFNYYELMQATPQTDRAVRLEFIASRAALMSLTLKNIDSAVLDSASDHFSCEGALPQASNTYEQSAEKALEGWRKQIRPNAFTIQRLLEEGEGRLLEKHELAAVGLCERQADYQ